MTARVSGHVHYWNELNFHGNPMWVDSTRGQFNARWAIRDIKRADSQKYLFKDTWPKVDRLEAKVRWYLAERIGQWT